MKRVKLAAIDQARADLHIIILAVKDRLELLMPTLREEEASFLRQNAERDVTAFFFPRAEGGVFIRILKSDKDAFAATEQARIAGNDILKELRQYKIEKVQLRSVASADILLPFAEGMALGSYQFLKYFSKPDKKEKPLREIYIEGTDSLKKDILELNALLDAVFLARDLVNEPQSFLSAPKLAEIAQETGAAKGFEVEILGKEKIESLKMGGILAVNQASDIPPAFCVLEYKPKQAPLNKKPIIVVGKGVVYDTGGLSLKPTEGMDYMKCDMAGAATVIGLLSVVADNQLPVHVIGLIPATDNKIGEKALAPGDVIRMYSGKTVEVLNTDAEGRLILADALHYAKKYNPELVIDLATLTGAAVRALGNHAICYMGTATEKTKKNIEKSGWATYERLVELPLWKEYGEELKSNIADIKNIGSGNAGMITAAKFLENFVDYPWLHLDIAGPAYLRSPSGYRTKEGTGIGVRLLYHFLKHYQH